MAQLFQSFDPDTVEDTTFDLLPKGDYLVQVIDSSEGPTKNETGRIVSLTLEVIEGEFAGRRIWLRLNYINDNAQAQQIGAGQLKTIMRAVGLEGQLLDTEDMHYKPFIASVSIRKDKNGNYDDQNDVRRAKPYTPGGAASSNNPNAPRRGPIGGSAPAARPNPSSARSTANGGAAATRPGPASGVPGGRPWPQRAQQQPVTADDDTPF